MGNRPSHAERTAHNETHGALAPLPPAGSGIEGAGDLFQCLRELPGGQHLVTATRNLLQNKEREKNEAVGKVSEALTRMQTDYSQALSRVVELAERLDNAADEEPRGLIEEQLTIVSHSRPSYASVLSRATITLGNHFCTELPPASVLPPSPFSPQQDEALKPVSSALMTRLQRISGDASEAVVQRTVETAVSTLVRNLPGGLPPRQLDLVGGSTRASIGPLKPDLVGVLVQAGALPYNDPDNVVIVGELKRPREDISSSACRGQLLHALTVLASSQRNRRGTASVATALGFLCNAHKLLFMAVDVSFTAVAPNKGVVSAVRQSKQLDASEGVPLLLSLFFSDPRALGHLLPVLHAPARFTGGGDAAVASGALPLSVQATALVGRGATAAGYIVPLPTGGSAIAKLITSADDGEVLCTAEHAVLTALAAARPAGEPPGPFVRLATDQGVWRDSENRPALLLLPVALHRYVMPEYGRHPVELEDWGLRAASAFEFVRCVWALAEVHRAGYVHRDARPENFFRDGRGEFFLGDFGSATAHGEELEPPRQQGVRFGPLSFLYDVELEGETAVFIASRPYTYSDDYEQVARCVYAAATKFVVPVELEDILLAWTAVAGAASLIALLNAAREAGAAVTRDLDSQAHLPAAARVLHEDARAALKAFETVIWAEYPTTLGEAVRRAER